MAIWRCQPDLASASNSTRTQWQTRSVTIGEIRNPTMPTMAAWSIGKIRIMSQKSILSSIIEIGVVPVVRTSTAEAAIKSIEAIHRGGILSAEITMTVPGAIRALEKIADQFGDKIILGAGTVLDPETARACMLAGAQFFVTPNLRPSTIEMIKRYSKVVMPGALTPTEVLTAWEWARTPSRSSPAARSAVRNISR